ATLQCRQRTDRAQGAHGLRQPLPALLRRVPHGRGQTPAQLDKGEGLPGQAMTRMLHAEACLQGSEGGVTALQVMADPVTQSCVRGTYAFGLPCQAMTRTLHLQARQQMVQALAAFLYVAAHD